MSAVVYAPHADPSAFYRLTEPARVLEVPVVEHLPAVGSADTVILNRPILPGMAEQVRLWRAEGRRVVVDIDDDFDAVVPEHQIHGLYTTEHLHEACKVASAVTCTTPALARRYGYGHGVVIRNRIPESYLSVTRRSRIDQDAAIFGQIVPKSDDTWVGWYGSLGSHPRDPATTGQGVGAAINPHPDVEFVFAGPPTDALRHGVQLGLERPVRELGFFSMDGLIQILSEFDIGIVPLESNPFNEAKSWLKGLELAAVGVPVVASCTSEYYRMARGAGFGHPPACWLANTPAEWQRQLEKLIERPEWRAELAANAKAWAATQTIERAADEWRAVWYSRDHTTEQGQRADVTTPQATLTNRVS